METLAKQARITCYIGHPFYMYLKLVLCPVKVPKVGLKVFLYWHEIVSDHISPYQSAHAFSPHMHSHRLISPANQALRSLANTGFQNCGVCLQAFLSFLPLPLPALSVFGSRFISRSAKTENPVPRSLHQNQTETLATLARIASYIGFLMPYQSSKGRVEGLSLLHVTVSDHITPSQPTCILTFLRSI